MASDKQNNVKGKIKEPICNNLESYEKSNLGNEAGTLLFVQNEKIDEYGSAISTDTSLVHLQDKHNSFLSLRGGKVIRKSSSNMVDYSTTDYHLHVGQDAQYVYQGDVNIYVKGSYNIQKGNQDSQVIADSEKLQKITTAIDNKCIEEIEKNAKNDEKIVCSICANSVDVDRASRMVNTVFKYITKLFNLKPNSPFSYLLEKIQAVLRTVLGFFIDSIPIAGLTGGSCGCTGCKDGLVSSPLYAIQQGNKAAAAEYEKNKKEIEKLQTQLPADHQVETHSSDYMLKVGLVKNESKVIALMEKNPIITELVKGKPDFCLIPSSKDSCRRASYSDPTILAGSYHLDVGQVHRISAGSGGSFIETTGMARFVGATTFINATEGEMVISSKNKTTISGANIVLESRQADGDAICLESDRVWVGGKLSVKGDLAVKGSVVMDGGIQCNHLITPIENTQTTVSSSAHNVHSAANWNNLVKPDATKMDIFDKVWKAISTNPVFVITKYILSPDAIKTIVEQQYSTEQISQTVDNTFLPTGFAMIYDYTTYAPIEVYSGTTLIGLVRSAMIPIYTYTHNHGSPGDPHGHSYIMPRMLGYDTASAATATRDEPSVIPTPARATGMGNTFGNSPTLGDLGPCGGGGSPFGNASRIRAAKLKRNQTYGINSYDAFGDKDYVDAPNVKYGEDGNIIPEPTFNLFKCD